jgi:hypothetical protein
MGIADARNISFNYTYYPKALTKAMSALFMAQEWWFWFTGASKEDSEVRKWPRYYFSNCLRFHVVGCLHTLFVSWKLTIFLFHDLSFSTTQRFGPSPRFKVGPQYDGCKRTNTMEFHHHHHHHQLYMDFTQPTVCIKLC